MITNNDRMFTVGKDQFLHYDWHKFTKPLPSTLGLSEGYICIHPISGIFAKYSNNYISFYALNGQLIDKIQISEPIQKMEWNPNCEKLVCFAKNSYQIFIFKFLNGNFEKKSTFLLKPLHENKSIITASLIFDFKFYCVTSCNNLYVFYNWNSDSSAVAWKKIQLDFVSLNQSIKYIHPIVNNSNLLLFSNSVAYYVPSPIPVYNNGGKSKGQTKLENFTTIARCEPDFQWKFPIFSALNSTVTAIVKKNVSTHEFFLDIYKDWSNIKNVHLRCKIETMPQNVSLLNGYLTIVIAFDQYIMIVNDKYFKKVELWQPFKMYQISPLSSLLLTNCGVEILSLDSIEISSKLMKRISSNEEIITILLEFSLNEFNEHQQNELLSIISSYTSGDVLDSSNNTEDNSTTSLLIKSRKFLQIINKIRNSIFVACFGVNQNTMENLIQMLVIRKEFDLAFELASLVSTSNEQITEKIFCQWLLSSTLNEENLEIKKHNLELSKIDQLKIEKSVVFKFAYTYKKLHPFALDLLSSDGSLRKEILGKLDLLSSFGNSDLKNFLKKLSADNRLEEGNFGCIFFTFLVFDVIQNFFHFQPDEIVKIIEVFCLDKDIGRFFQDYCFWTGKFEILDKFYYCDDENQLREFLKSLPKPGFHTQKQVNITIINIL